MKLNKFIKVTVIALGMIGLAACSSTRGAGANGAPITDVAGGAGSGAYAEGAGGYGAYGSGGGSDSTANCHPRSTAMQSSYFDFDKSDVRPEAVTALQALAPKLASGSQNIDVVGNTDDRGSREYNLALGTRRANAVASILQQNGVSKSQITVDSNGAEYPIASGNTDEDYQCNRRSDVCVGKCNHG